MTDNTVPVKSVEEPEKLDLRSHHIADDKRAELLHLFPEIRTEGGKIDFDQLKRILGETVDPGRERYGMTWPGKADCFKTIQQPSLGTLLPCREESVNFDTTENLVIEGDNLEVLKLLQKSYLGKVKMIYIDPPYNTGNDFIYPDNFTESLQTYLEYSGQLDNEGRKFSTNTETNGRFHSKWLSMMYPRLYLARNLLKEDGVIFISIDDYEGENLRRLCDEIFGEENFIAQLVWEKGRKNDAKRFSVGHEYLVGYARNLSLIEEIAAPWREPKPGVADIVDEYLKLKHLHGSNFAAISAGLVAFYRSLDELNPAKKYARSRFVDRRGIWRDNNISWPGGGGPRYDLIHPLTKKPCKVPDDGWRFVETTMLEKVKQGYIEFREDHTATPFLKSYLYVDGGILPGDEEESGEKYQVMGSVFYRHSQPSNDVMRDLFGEKIFENPKDHEVIARLIRYCTDSDDIILDFFAGSGTTAHAVLDLNKRDGGRRKFILVQLPEPTRHQKADGTWDETLAWKKGFETIAEITKERARRVIKAATTAASGQLPLSQNASSPDVGVAVFKLAESNIRVWADHTMERTPEVLAQQLELHIDHIREDRSAEDILYEVLLKSGFPLGASIEPVVLEGKTIYSVADGAMLICLDRSVTSELMKAIADGAPQRVVCLDVAFARNDQLKTNAVQIMKAKGVTSFRTV